MTPAARPTIKHIYQNYILDSTHWDGFQVRDGDIVIATSYKTGTTWMQGICAALVFQAPELPAAQDDLSPWLDARFAPAEETLALLEGLTHRRYIKTHLPLDGLPFSDRIKYIFVGRDGLDVFMSLWHHWNNMRPESIDEINATPGRVMARYRRQRGRSNSVLGCRRTTSGDPEQYRSSTTENAVYTTLDYILPRHGTIDRQRWCSNKENMWIWASSFRSRTTAGLCR